MDPLSTPIFSLQVPRQIRRHLWFLPPYHKKKMPPIITSGMLFSELVKDRTMKRKNTGHTTLSLPLSLPKGESLGSS